MPNVSSRSAFFQVTTFLLWILLILGWGSRNLYYTPIEWPESLQLFFQHVLNVQYQAWVVAATLFTGFLWLILLLLVWHLIRFRSCWYPHNQQWHTRPWLYTLILAVITALQSSIDLNPWMGWIGVLWMGLHYGSVLLGKHILWLLIGSVSGAFFVWHSHDVLIQRLILWLGVVFLLESWVLRRFFAKKEHAWVLLGSMMAFQLVGSLAPKYSHDWHHGQRLEGGWAYAFCENEDSTRLYASNSQCEFWTHGCEKGTLNEYELPSLKKRHSHSPFHDDFYGRMQQLICLPNQVIASMNSTKVGDVFHNASVLSMSWDPSLAEMKSHLLLYGDTGHRMAYDSENEAFFFVSELTPTLIRYDLKTQHFEDLTHLILPYVSESHSMTLSVSSIHKGRQSLYLAPSVRGNVLLEMDLSTYAIKKVLPINDGIVFSVAVDEPLNRMYLGRLFGVDVLDLDTGQWLFHKRTGVAARLPVINEEDNRVYVPVTYEGKIRVYDRQNWDHLYSIPIGWGVRFPHWSKEHQRFFASSNEVAFVFEEHSRD